MEKEHILREIKRTAEENGIYSPRLAHTEDAAERLKMEVSPEGDEAGQ